MDKIKVGFLGCGNMGGSIARRICIGDRYSVFVYDKDTEKARAFAEDYFPKQYGESYQGISGIRCDCRKIGGKVYGFCTVTCTAGESGQPASEISEEFIVSES